MMRRMIQKAFLGAAALLVVLTILGAGGDGVVTTSDKTDFVRGLSPWRTYIHDLQDEIIGAKESYSSLIAKLNAIQGGSVAASQWQESGQTPTFVDSDTFTVSTDLTAKFEAGRRVQAELVTTNFVYSYVVSSSFASNITTVNLRDTNLTSSLSKVYYALLDTGTDFSVPVSPFQNLTSCSLATLEGEICWDTDDDTINFGTGSGIKTPAFISNNLSVFAATTSAQLLGVLSDETGTLLSVFSDKPIFTTDITSPIVYGGSAVGSTLTLAGTSNGSPSSAHIILNASGQGAVGIGITPTSTAGYATLSMNGSTGSFIRTYANSVESLRLTATTVNQSIDALVGNLALSGAAVTVGGGNLGVGDTTPASLFVVGDGDDFQISSTGAFQTSSVGPHAIGGAIETRFAVKLFGSFTPGSSNGAGMSIGHTLISGVNESTFGVVLNPTIVEAGSGVHASLSGLVIAPAFTSGLATVTTASALELRAFTAPSGTTNAASLYIASVPTAATNNYAFWVADGVSRFDGNVQAPTIIGGSAVGSTLTLAGTSNGAPVNAHIILNGSGQGNVGIGDTTPASLFTVGDGDDFQVSSTGAVTTNNTIKSTAADDIGWTVQSAANQACNATCTTGACVVGIDTLTLGNFLACTDTAADSCLCAA